MRKIISHFIKYPLLVNVIIFAVVVLGIIGMFRLRSSFFPLQESKIITIQIAYPGASPQEMEEGIVLKIEDNLRGLVGIDRFTSSSSENTATITVEILEGYDINALLADVKNAVDKVPSYPSGMEPPVVSKQENLSPAVSLVVRSEALSLRELKREARRIESELRRLDGISQFTLSGFPEEEIVVALREDDLRAYQLSFAQVSNAISANNLLSTGGSVKTQTEEYLIRVSNRGYYAENLENIPVKALPSGEMLLLRQVADVRDAWSEIPDRLYFNGQKSIRLDVSTTNNEDLLSAANKILAYGDRFNEQNDQIKISVIRDRSIVIRQRTELLLKNGFQGILLVLLFLSLFLKPRLAFWVAFGLPISFLGMFIFAGHLGVTVNVLSLFGMIIVIGILVDDGIVIAENIYHHYEQGKTRVRAAIDGTMEVIPAIVSAILTTLLAFSTFFFLKGRIGDFFSEVSIVVFLTLIVSLVEALIILPSHVGHSRALSPAQKNYAFNNWSERWLFRFRDRIYAPLLDFFLRNKVLGFAIFFALLFITIGGLRGGIIKGTFFPVISSDQVSVEIKMPQGVNPSITDSIATVIEEAAYAVNREFTERQTGGHAVVENVIKSIGPGTARGKVELNLLPGEERDFPAYEIAEALAQKCPDFPRAESVVYSSGSTFGGKPVSVSLMSGNIDQLKKAKEHLSSALKDDPRLRDISDNDPAGIKEILLRLKPQAFLLGLDYASVISQVRSGFYGFQAQRFQRGRDEIKVWVRYNRSEREAITNLDQMHIIAPNGARIPLMELADYHIERGEISINHLNGKREIKVEADMKNPKESATEILDKIRNEIMPEIQSLYPNVTALYEGQNREASKTQNSAAATFPVILLLIFVVIAFTFRTFSQPLMLLGMIPFSLIGVGWGHYLHGFPINILSFLGIIALIGIMVNDGLVLIGKFNQFLKLGLPYREALLEAGKSRFRAIFLTSVTTIAGLSPLIFETSRQAQFLIPMAISIAYGIGVATVLTLILLPMLLSLVNQCKVWTTWAWTGRKPDRESVERAVKELQVENDTDDHDA